MVGSVSGRWPWESGAMPGRAGFDKTALALGPKAPMYTLPMVKDRRAENGKRFATVKDLVCLKRARERSNGKYFLW